MAYALRYYKELIHEDGSTHRLEIHKKDSTAEAVEIGAVIQGLALEIQGSQGDVDSPIVKTSLSMTFVDAGDIENGQKNGFWQEFYTPDALLWKVILKARTATETSFRTIWGGYVTPDSFSESLVYRGSVNIIARDNLGHMQDFPFDAVGDADGLISLRNLVESGWEKIQSPMVLDWRGESESTMWLMCDGVPAPDTLMNVSQFEGMDWYKAIETALASYGIVMRWVGDNIVNVSSLRSMPLQGREVYDNLSQITPVFVAGAQRELVPAVRRIEESVDYDLAQDYQPRIDIQDFSGNTFDVETSWGVVSGIAWSLIESTPMSSFGWYNEVPFKTLAFNPAGYDIDENISESERENIRKATCLLTGSKNDDTHSLSYAMLVNPEDYAIGISFGRFLSRLTHGDGHYFLGYPINEPTDAYRVRYAVKTTYDGVDYYLTSYGEWTDSFVTQTQEVQGDTMSIDIPLSGIFVGMVQISLIFLNIDTGEDAVRIKQILGLSLSNRSNKAYLEKNTVNTAYNAENNVILSRTPEMGPAYDAVALPGFIKNGIFYRSEGVILPARAWGWSGSTPQQMAVYNHLQLLCYYAKPNNLISGTIVNGDLTGGGAIYIWHGKEHLLVSGRYNLLNGMIEGAMLREFTRYEDMWGEVSETAFPDTEQDSTTNVEGGASSGGSSSTYTNTTTVNIGSGGGGGASYLNDLLDVNADSVTAQSVLYYNGTEWVGRSLSTILNGYAKSADLLTLSDLLASMWSIDTDGNLVTDKQVIIKSNLIVHGDTASGGTGGGAAIGVTGILVDGKQYTDTDSDGYIDLSGAFAGLSPTITSAMITEALGYTPANSASLGSLAYLNSLSKSDVGLGNVDNLAASGYLTALSSNTTNAVSITVGGTTKTITAAILKSSLGLGSNAYTSTAYLPLSGGTLTGNGAGLLAINRQDGNPVIEFRNNGSVMGRYGFTTDGTPIGVVGGSQVTLIHSGNIGSYKSGDSDKLGGLSASSYVATKTITGDLNAADLYASRSLILSLNSSAQNVPSGMNSGEGIYIAGYDTGFMLLSSYTQDKLMYRRGTNSLGSNTILSNAWKTIAFTDSTVASAYKLVTSAGADAVINANGCTYVYGDLWVWAQDASDRVVRLRNDPSDLYTRLKADGSGEIFVSGNYALKFGTANTARVFINSYGNVTIGDSDLAGTSAKLYVDGGIELNSGGIDKVSSIAHYDSKTGYFVGRRNSGLGVTTGGLLLLSYGATPISFYTNSSERMHITSGGNVGIGNASPSYKLDVAGTGRFTGAVTMSSTLSVTGTLSAKGSIEVYGSTPYIDFHFGNATDDYTSRIIEIASGNLAVYANWLPNTNNAKKLGNSDRRWSEIFGVNGNLSGTLNVGGASTFNGDVRINGNLVVTGDIAA